MSLIKALSVGLALSGLVAAHPGEHHDHSHIQRAIRARDNYAAHAARSLESCSNTAGARKLKTRAVERRAQKVRDLRDRLNIKSTPQKYRRDLASLQAWENVNHNMTSSVDYDMFTPLENIFGANTSCILSPETTAGPYYIIGEPHRSNVIESQYCEGVPVFLEVQYVDITTCDPVPSVAVDHWSCNATGIYSGISTNGNYAANGLNSTYLRGVQITDHDGVAQFETIFPGHYEGRATHTHLLAHMNATLMPNGTISVWDAPVTHIGQLFYPEDLRNAVEELAPYNTNTQAVTTNDEDMWSIVAADAAFDPFPQFVYLGDSLQDGLFAWIQIGVNASADYSEDEYYGVAGYLDSEGGHALDSGIGGGGGGGNGTGPGGAGPSGAMPSGAMPSGAPPS
ncbi:Intradiol ring-cleavage dioxygenase [Plectosphaerella plurivora]|uniref:Intradiol ring-cleavage dioxygenase n=1 Tax=Plectosphaerella plurivora TaxID=936078 RepID=A0A9P9ACR2_9PEZI|nr:Intradiol ring-cleavage dioxygenase [Plectosphaerella plurivora]